ncbi:LLM class flavin-dependent oxidoreductase [Haloflavibacter putidus]|uniref:Luciferase-like monooxygenase n=1 Tax=Haloflavibacter putidus TaxID=2576776 RepID=A0A507ZM98_9FLAO|nr:LLM class flavin-dependent oxidoreductase [Haloflavibacter putidus]TQD38640.1 LLM class flavin-dependent oxidoreductase [Haloflavibacter putidus]
MATNNLQAVKYSMLELAVVGQDIPIPQVLENSLETAQKAEELGFNRFWLAEHHNMKAIASSATSILIGYIAGGTKNIRVGSGGVMLPNHAPLIIAEQFGTLAQLYPNRIDLGLGRAPGTDQTTAQEIRSDRMQAVYRFPDEIDKIQAFIDRNYAKVRAPIAEGVNLPFYVLGSSTDSAYVAAKKGLPYVFASHFAPTHLKEALRIYRENFQASKFLEKPYVIAGINVVAAPTQEEAETLSTSMLQMTVGILTQKMTYMQPPIPMNDELQKIKHHPAVAQMNKFAFVGDAATIKTQIEDFVTTYDINELMVSCNVYEQEKRIQSLEILAKIMQGKTA